MKRVVVLVKNLTSGGAEKQSVLLAKSLSKKFTVHYVILNGKYQEAKYLALLDEDRNIVVKAFNGSLLLRFISFCSYLKSNKIDIIFSYLTAANFFSVLASKISGVANVFTGIRNAYLPPAKLIIDKILCNNYATGVVLNCYSGRQYFVERGFQEKKMHVIPNCFENIEKYTEKDYNHELIRIITVGRFVEQKDYRTALESIRLLFESKKNIRFIIVGHGSLESEIRDMIEKFDLLEIVELYVNPDNIGELLNNSDIYLSTSLFEGTSNSIMEAMNANLPIVATNVGDNYCLVQENRNGFLCEIRDTINIARKLEYLVINAESRVQMGQLSKELLENEYSQERFQSNYENLIFSVL